MIVDNKALDFKLTPPPLFSREGLFSHFSRKEKGPGG
jgi:hypothetical protein